jgi:ribonuclease BN (tRNA processing enzyme)
MVDIDDELVFLGSGGGRIHVRTQHRATGGVLLKFNGIQAHIDPGPGAIIRINQFNEDPLKTELFFVTHLHTDHFISVLVMIEAARARFRDAQRNMIKRGTLITTPEIADIIKFISQYHLDMLENIVPFGPGETYNYKGVNIVGTMAKHTEKQSFGIKFELDDYSIAFTSDTMAFDEFPEQFHGVNILVLNLLRPDSVSCRRHICTDEVIPLLNQINPVPNALVITHFGAYMDSPRSDKNYVPSQVEKLKAKTNIKKIIAAEDGLKLKIIDLLE